MDEKDYKWELSFEDNFDRLDKSIWKTEFDNGNRTIWSNKELQWYKDDNVIVENGILKLIAKEETVFGKDPENENNFNFTSGMICNSKSPLQAYGKWEMKVRFPFKYGFWPAFFLVPKQIPTLPEIDIFEYFGMEKNKIYTTHHWGLDYPNYPGGKYESKTEPFYYQKSKEIEGSFSNKWMVWSFECYPNYMVWKLDGEIVNYSSEGIPTAPLYLIANVAVKDFKTKDTGIEKNNLPYIMEIDYVKIYKMVPK